MRDADVRFAISEKLANLHAGDADTCILEEMGVWSGSARIDVAVINGELCGYELKSNKDTLERLPLQIEIYKKVFDRLTLVVGRRHFDAAKKIIPDWWGLILANYDGESVELSDLKAPLVNPDQEAYFIAQLLWRDEVLQILQNLGLDKGWRSKSVKSLHTRLATELELRHLKEQVRSALKSRQVWLRQNRPDQRNVAINANLHPMLKALRPA